MSPALYLNPAVARAADLMTDRLPSDAFLRDVAAMHGLPLLVARMADTAPSALDVAEREMAAAEASRRATLAIYRGACARLGEANAWFDKPLRPGGPRRPISAETRRREQGHAMRHINSRRVLLRQAVRRLDAARVALLALAS